MNIITKRSFELTIEEQDQITALFNRVFSKNEVRDDFIKKYFWTDEKGSFHAIMKDEEKIVGCYCAIPYQYTFFGTPLRFGLCVDTMLDEAYRGNPFTLKKMATAVYDNLRQNNIPFVFGFPNDNAYLLQKRILKFDDIGLQDFYVLPIRVGKIKSSLKFANIASQLFVNILVRFTQLTMQKPTIQSPFNIQMDYSNDKFFFSKRYAKDYRVVNDENGYFAYKIYIENEASVAYLIDIQPLNQNNVEQAVIEIYNRENVIDVIIFAGKLPFPVRNLIKVPQKYVPKEVRMIGLILDKSLVDERVFSIANWQVGIANYDVR